MPLPLIISRVTDEKQLREIYRLRYKIYCEEWGFEKPEDYPDGIETDIYDKSSVHFSVKNKADKVVGTVRLILDSPEGFPIEKHCNLDIDKNKLLRDRLAEISRLAISKDYRKRSEDRYIYGPDEERRIIGSFNYSGTSYSRRAEDRHYRHGFYRGNRAHDDRRKRHEVIVSLCKAIYRESKTRGLTHWYAIMTKGLYILLKKYGFNFQAIGDPVDYHGIRTPYLGEIKRIEEDVLNNNPELYEEFAEYLQGE